MRGYRGFAVFMLTAIILAGCAKSGRESVALQTYPLDNLDGVIALSGVEFDAATSSDGKGALKITSGGAVTAPIFETGDIDAEDTALTYQAKVRAEGVEGRAYIEMWCSFGGKGEFFSRGLDTALTGTTGWTTQTTQFFLRPGENPDNVKLNIVVEGKGTVWVDDIKLLKIK